MSHDFKSRAGNKKKPAKNSKNNRITPIPGRIPGWLYFISGVAITLFVQLLYHLAMVETPAPAQPVTATTPDTVKAKPAPKPKEPVYDFYNNLKTMEVKVPNEVVKQREQDDYNYALQAGSFRSMNDAEQQRAEISLLGLKANIESSKGSNGSTWYRVVVGPFTSRSNLNKARSILINNGMPTLLVKR